MEEQRIVLPQELQYRILTHIADCRSACYLGKCALVSKKWLQEARRLFFLDRTVHVYLGAYDDGSQDEILLNLLCQNEPICTFWPYILDMYLCGYYPRFRATEHFIKLLSLCSSRASNLQTIWIDCMEYSDSLKDAVSNFTATHTITSIRIEDSYFPSPKELDLFLGLFPQPHAECQLSSIYFGCGEWDPASSCIFSPAPSTQFLIDIEIPEYSVLELEFFLHHQWNITDLRLKLMDAGSTNFHLVTSVLKHIGASLKSLNLDTQSTLFQGKFYQYQTHNYYY